MKVRTFRIITVVFIPVETDVCVVLGKHSTVPRVGVGVIEEWICVIHNIECEVSRSWGVGRMSFGRLKVYHAWNEICSLKVSKQVEVVEENLTRISHQHSDCLIACNDVVDKLSGDLHEETLDVVEIRGEFLCPVLEDEIHGPLE
jgi:hypothetical protein